MIVVERLDEGSNMAYPCSETGLIIVGEGTWFIGYLPSKDGRFFVVGTSGVSVFPRDDMLNMLVEERLCCVGVDELLGIVNILGPSVYVGDRCRCVGSPFNVLTISAGPLPCVVEV